MTSLVLSLQEEALSANVPVVRLLAKAKAIAAKLDLGETEHWINVEINGYREGDEIPAYRYVHGELKGHNPYRGWMPIQMEDPKDAKGFESRAVFQSMAQVEDLLRGKDSVLTMTLPQSARNQLFNALELPPDDIKYFIPRNQFVNIRETVRQRILDWTLKLEKNGIKGEGLSFSTDEKKRVSADRTVYNINIENMAGSIGSLSGKAVVNASQTIQGVDPEALQVLLASLRELLEGVQFVGREKVEAGLAKLDEEAAGGEPRKKTVVEGLKAISGLIG
jgi:hypothetical protein